MIKKALCISLCLIGLGSVEAMAYESSVQNQSFDPQDIAEFDNEVITDIKEYINTEEPLAHGHRHRRHRRHGERCYPVTIPVGPPVWGWWGWYQPTRVIMECHFIEPPPVYRRPRRRLPRRPRRSEAPPQSLENNYCDYVDDRGRGRNRYRGRRSRNLDNLLFNALCDNDTSTIRDLLEEEGYYSVNERAFTGETPLILATKLGNRRIVRLLVRFGADICMRTEGLTAIDWAYELGYERIEEYLEERSSRSSRCF